MTIYLCTATLIWQEESQHNCSYAQCSKITNVSASSEEKLYEQIAVFRVKHERIEGQPNLDEDWDSVIQWHEEVRVKFGPIMKAEVTPLLEKRLHATKAWKAHETALFEHMERKRLRLEEQAEEEVEQQEQENDADMQTYLRIKVRPEVVGGELS